jgi:hypothetical protein
LTKNKPERENDENSKIQNRQAHARPHDIRDRRCSMDRRSGAGGGPRPFAVANKNKNKEKQTKQRTEL